MLLPLLAALLLPGAAGAGPPLLTCEDLRARPQPKPDLTIAYGKDPLQVIDVWRPAGAGTHPVVIMVHGGCWKTSIAQRDIMNWIAGDLRARGVGVWNIEYRGVDRGGGMPGTYEDVGKAADLLLTDGVKYGLGAGPPLIAIGHSAGGHLALWLARRPALPAGDPLRRAVPVVIDLAISQGGLPDLRAQTVLADHGCGRDGASAMAGGDFARSSPQEMPLGTARDLLFNNELDTIAPPDSGTAYVAAMAARGVAVEVVTTPAEGHAELIAPGSVSWTRQRDAILAALHLTP